MYVKQDTLLKHPAFFLLINARLFMVVSIF